MHRSLCRLVALVLTLASPAAWAQDVGSLDALAWLAGCWAGERADEPLQRFEEQWMAPRAGVMLGMGRMVRGGKLVEHEQMLIREEGGALVYTARPSGQASVSFRAASAHADGIVFENPLHDFPQRISYRLLGDGSLLARIEGERRGRTRAVEFPMKRVDCPG